MYDNNSCIRKNINLSKMKIVQILPDLRIGGAELIAINLANEWVKNNNQCEIWLLKKKGEYIKLLDPRIIVRDLNCARLRNLPFKLFMFIKKYTPDQIVSQMWPYTTIITISWILAGNRSKLTLVEQVCLSEHIKQDFQFPFWLFQIYTGIIYRLATNLVASSKGAAADLSRILKLSEKKINMISNPIVETPLINLAVREDKKIRKIFWKNSTKCILSIGTFKAQKNYSLLIKSFSLIANETNANLVIVGDGVERELLEKQIIKLNLLNRVFLPGKFIDPIPFLLAADLFVLSSNFEGLPTVIVQALATGTPVVSTDCPHGPSEIIKNSDLGILVPKNDSRSLSMGILKGLKTKWDRKILQKRALNFSINKQSKKYLSLFKSNA